MTNDLASTQASFVQIDFTGQVAVRVNDDGPCLLHGIGIDAVGQTFLTMTVCYSLRPDTANHKP